MKERSLLGLLALAVLAACGGGGGGGSSVTPALPVQTTVPGVATPAPTPTPAPPAGSLQASINITIPAA